LVFQTSSNKTTKIINILLLITKHNSLNKIILNISILRIYLVQTRYLVRLLRKIVIPFWP